MTPEEDIAQDGEAIYNGSFAGLFVVPGTDGAGFVGAAFGAAEFTADFLDMEVDGGVTDIVIEGFNLDGAFRSAPAGGIDFDDVTIDGNTFTGGVVPSADDGFAAFDDASTGTLDGTFYGDTDEFDDFPLESGVVLTLQDSESPAYITGAIGAGLLVDDR